MNLLLSQIHAGDDSDGVSPVKPKIMSTNTTTTTTIIKPNTNPTKQSQSSTSSIITDNMNIGGEDMMKYINNIRADNNDDIHHKELETNINISPDIFLNPKSTSFTNNNNSNNSRRFNSIQQQQQQSFSYINNNDSLTPNIPLYNNYNTNNDVTIPSAPILNNTNIQSLPKPKTSKRIKSKPKKTLTKQLSHNNNNNISSYTPLPTSNSTIITIDRPKPKTSKKIRSKSVPKMKKSLMNNNSSVMGNTNNKQSIMGVPEITLPIENDELKRYKEQLEMEYKQKYKSLENNITKQYELNNYNLNKMKLNYEQRIDELERKLYYSEELCKQANYTVQKLVKSDIEISQKDLLEERVRQLEKTIAASKFTSPMIDSVHEVNEYCNSLYSSLLHIKLNRKYDNTLNMIDDGLQNIIHMLSKIEKQMKSKR